MVVIGCCVASAAVRIPKVTTWTRLDDYPLKVTEGQGTFLGDKKVPRSHLVCGGFSGFPGVTSKCYKRQLSPPTNPQWLPAADLPEPLTHMAQAHWGSKLYTAGGYLGSHPGMSINSSYIYNLRSDSWTKLPDLPGDRAGGGLIFRREKSRRIVELIYAGGGDRMTNAPNPHVDHGDTWVLNLKNLAAGWVDQGVKMPDPRNHQGAVRSCGRYYWVGGQHKENERSGNRVTCNEYFPDDQRWGSIADLPIPLGHISASTLPYRCGIIVIAGVTQQKARSKNIYYWEPKGNKWYFIGEYPLPLATPVCGIRRNTITCATGSSLGRNRVYTTTLASQQVAN